MSAPGPRELTLVAAAVALAIVMAIGGALLAPPADDLPSGSSFSHGPSGSAAAYQTLLSAGYAVRRSFEPLPSIKVAPGATVMVIADPAERASNQDRRALQTFVALGGTVLVTGCAGATFLRALQPASARRRGISGPSRRVFVRRCPLERRPSP